MNLPAPRALLSLLAVASFALPALAQDPPASAPASQPAPPPPDPAALRAHGAELSRAGRKDEAIAAWRAAWEADHSLESALGLARALMADARLNDADRALAEADKTHHAAAALHVCFGDLYATIAATRASEGADGGTVRSMYEEAARSLEDAIQRSPRDVAIQIQCSRYLLLAGKPDEGLEWATKARKEDPKSWEAALVLGDAHYQDLIARGLFAAENLEGEELKKERATTIDAALAAYREAAKLGPDHSEGQSRIGALLVQTKGDLETARKAYSEALAIAPATVDPSPILAEMKPKELLAYIESALADFTKRHPKTAADSPADALLHWYLGYARHVNDDRKGAIESFERVTKKTPADPSARYYLGKLSYLGQDFPRAIAEFDTLARKTPRDLAAVGATDGNFVPMVQGLIARLVGGNGGAITSVEGNPNIDIAIRFTRALLELNPKDAAEWNNLAFFYRDSQRYKESLDAYKHALDLSPTDPSLLNDTAVIYHYYLRTNDAEARALYERAIARANDILADKKSGAQEKETARTALRDASGNLRKLNAGSRKND